jgi:hypothetical protein
LEDRKLAVVIIAFLASVIALVFGAGAAVRGSYWLATGLFIFALLAIVIYVWQAKHS